MSNRESCKHSHCLDSISFVQATANVKVYDGENFAPQTDENVWGECHIKGLSFVTREQVNQVCLTHRHPSCKLFSDLDKDK